MNSVLPETEDSARRKGRMLLAAMIGVAILFAVLIFRMASAPEYVISVTIIWTIFAAFGFNALSYLARWLLTKNRRRTFISGRFPFVVGMTKFVAVMTTTVLILLFSVGLIAGGEFRRASLQAMIVSLLYSTVLSLIGNGLMNVLIVVRHFRGTLKDTTRAAVGPRGWF